MWLPFPIDNPYYVLYLLKTTRNWARILCRKQADLAVLFSIFNICVITTHLERVVTQDDPGDLFYKSSIPTCYTVLFYY